MTTLKLKRAYSPEEADDGFRVYIDRLWPRGLSHETFHYDVWDKEIAPSDDLRHWFHDNPEANWSEFESRYRAELAVNPSWPGFVASLEPHPTVTLLYSSHNETENNAVVLADQLIAHAPTAFTRE